jgi:hypothetical protein
MYVMQHFGVTGAALLVWSFIHCDVLLLTWQVHALAEQLRAEVQAMNGGNNTRPASHGRGLSDQQEEDVAEDEEDQWPGSGSGRGGKQKGKGKQGGGLQVKYSNTRGFYLVIPQPTDKNGNPQDIRLPR